MLLTGLVGMWIIGMALGLWVLQTRDVLRIFSLAADMAGFVVCVVIVIFGFVSLEERGPAIFGLSKDVLDLVAIAVMIRAFVLVVGYLKRKVGGPTVETK